MPTTADAVSIAERLYPALATGDRDTLDEILAPDFVGETTAGLPLELGGRYVGARSMRRDFWGAIGRAYDVTAEPRSLVAVGPDQVVVSGTYRGTARSTGRSFEAEFVHVLTVRDGSITALTQVTDSGSWAQALKPTSDPYLEPALSSLTYSVSEGLAHIELARPESANAINAAMARDLRTAITRCARDRSVRALLITGQGRRFCAGGDIALFAGTDAAELPALLDEMIGNYHVALQTLAELDVPVVCAVRGAAAGGGLGLLHGSDIVIAADDSKYALGFSALALSGDGGNSWYLPRLVGPRIAAQMYLQNRVLTAAEALAAGVVTELVPSADVAPRAHDIARTLAAGPSRAFAGMRTLLRRSFDVTLVDQLDAERRTIVGAAATADAAEGVAAFIDKRTPVFRGK